MTGRPPPPPPPGQSWPRLCIVGPLPPPSGGMANQCEQLLRLLRADAASVELVRTNSPYRPAWLGRLPMVRALARLLPYLLALWQAAGRAQVMHVLANSGWAWHMFAAPALCVARLRGTPVIVNYRGGHAEAFFAKAPRHVLRALAGVRLRVTPSRYLERVFAGHGLAAQVIPNIIDLSRFTRHAPRSFGDAPHLVVARNLEPIYDMPTALRAMVLVRQRFPAARMTIAGSGPELAALQALSVSLGLDRCVQFAGRIDNAQMPALYACADLALNPSTVDNMPNSLLEAFASGVPLVSTDAGGIPDIARHGVDAWLVPVADAQAMADAACALLADSAMAGRMADAAHQAVQAYAWPEVKRQWLQAYRLAAGLEAQP